MTAMQHRDFETLEGMSADAAAGLQGLLWGIADTKLLLGYHYGEWTFGTPELEAAVASCSLAQAELGHVRLLHGILKKHWAADPEQLLERRAPTEFANIAYLDHPITDWTGFVAMNAVVDLAATRVLAALEGSTFKPLRATIGKMLDEERHHAHHGRGWFRTLGRRGGEAATQLGMATSRALAAATTWLGPPDDPGDGALAAAGLKGQTMFELFTALSADVQALASDSSIEVRPTPVSFAGWNPRTRRVGESGPADEIVFHLRGSANEVFKLGE